MRKCSQYQEKLWEYYDGTLSAEEAAELEKHLERCAACAAEAKLVKQMMENLHTLPEADLPEGYHTELMEKIAKENLAKVSVASIDQTEKQETGTVVPFPQKRRKNWKNFGLVAAAVVLVAAAGGIQGIQHMRAPQEAIIQEAKNLPKESGNVKEEIIVSDNDRVEPMTEKTQDTATKEPTGTTPVEPKQTTAQPKITEMTPKTTKTTETTETTQSPDAINQTNAQGAQTVVEENRQGQPQAEQPLQGTYAMNDGLTEGVAEASTEAVDVDQPVVRANEIQTPEQISLTVTDIADAMTDIRAVITEMELTEKEATETSITVTMQEKQKQTFLDELAEIGTLPEAEISDSTSETMVDVKVVCVEAKK